MPPPNDVPKALRNLKPEITAAAVGCRRWAYERAESGKGHRINTAMMSFAWAPIAVPDKIALRKCSFQQQDGGHGS